MVIAFARWMSWVQANGGDHARRQRMMWPNDPDGLAPAAAALTGEEGAKTHPVGRGAYYLNAEKRAGCSN